MPIRPSLWLALGIIVPLLAAPILWSVTECVGATMVADSQTVTKELPRSHF